MNSQSPLQILIAGGGIAGLATGVACATAGHLVRVYERSQHLTEAGAGIQLGPNVTRILRDWSLLDAVQALAVQPDCLLIRDTKSGRSLGQLSLKGRADARYGAPYLTVHRADLHACLLAGLRQRADVFCHTGRAVVNATDDDIEGVTLTLTDDQMVQGDVLVAADGLWSELRSLACQDGAPVATGHVAYRALIKTSDLPPHLRASAVTVWLGPHVHVVQYPVRGGELMNVVVIAAGEPLADAFDWSNRAPTRAVYQAVGGVCVDLADTLDAAGATDNGWLAWQLFDRPPVAGPDSLYKGRVALLGDAAHPMRPYLAQGAGMAIEDANALATVLPSDPSLVSQSLFRYANNRWARVARVQQKAKQNGDVFHATGLKRMGRDLAMRMLGSRLIDQPWLYG